jgi:hypothetical protein
LEGYTTTPQKIERLRKYARRGMMGEILTASELDSLCRIALEMGDMVEIAEASKAVAACFPEDVNKSELNER